MLRWNFVPAQIQTIWVSLSNSRAVPSKYTLRYCKVSWSAARSLVDHEKKCTFFLRCIKFFNLYRAGAKAQNWFNIVEFEYPFKTFIVLVWRGERLRNFQKWIFFDWCKCIINQYFTRKIKKLNKKPLELFFWLKLRNF